MKKHSLTTKEQISRQTSIAFLLLLALASNNFQLLGAYIFMLACVIYIGINFEFIRIGRGICPLIIFSVAYFLFVFPHSAFISAAKIFICPAVWVLGYNLPERSELRGVFKVSIYLAVGMAVHGMMNFFYNTAIGTVISNGRTLDFWSGVVSTATGQATNFSLFVAFVFWLVVVQRNVLLKILSLAIYVVSLIYDIQMGGRTFLVLSVAAFLLGLVFYLYDKVLKQWDTNKLLTIFLGIIFISIFLIYAVRKDLWGIRSIYEESYLYVRLNIHETSIFAVDGRLAIKIKYLKNMGASLLGGHALREHIVGNYAHDLWLDVYDEAGVFAFSGIVAYTLCAIFRVWKIVREKSIPYEFRSALMCYMTIVILQFCVEPILQGAPMLLYSFILIDGMLAGFLQKLNRRNVNCFGDEVIGEDQRVGGDICSV